MSRLSAILVLPASLLLVACGREAPPTSSLVSNPAPVVAELEKRDIVVGTGPAIAQGQKAVVHYTGWLYEAGAPEHKGKQFDSSRDRGVPFRFDVGAGKVIAGWDQGVQGMQVGGQRRLIIPAFLAYGDRGGGGVIPPNAPLMFDVELLAIE